MTAKLFFLGSGSDLVERIRQGDRKALLELFDDNRRPIVTLVTRNGGSVDEADDVLQEAVIVLWERIRSGTFEERAALSTFIYGVAKRLWLRRLTRRSRESGTTMDLHDIGDSLPNPEEQILTNEATELVSRALAALDATCRSLLLLFYWEALPTEEIGRLMGFANAATVKARKYQCKERLRRIMQEMSDE